MGTLPEIAVSRKGRTKPCTARTAINRTASPHFLQRGKRSRAVKVAWCIMRWSTCSMRYIPLFGTLSPGLYSAFFDTFFIKYTATWGIKMRSSRSLVACSSLKIVVSQEGIRRFSPTFRASMGQVKVGSGCFSECTFLVAAHCGRAAPCFAKPKLTISRACLKCP